MPNPHQSHIVIRATNQEKMEQFFRTISEFMDVTLDFKKVTAYEVSVKGDDPRPDVITVLQKVSKAQENQLKTQAALPIKHQE